MNTKDRIIHQMSVADDVLKKLRLIDSHAIIAGGAPRDWSLNRIASDIDVFFYKESPIYTLSDVESNLMTLGFKVEFISPSQRFDESCYVKNPALRHVFNCRYKREKIQFIRMSEPTFTSVVDTFPLNICKIWYRNGEIRATKDYARAIKHKAIVKVNNLYANGDKYIQKILSKFPDYKYYESYEQMFQDLLD